MFEPWTVGSALSLPPNAAKVANLGPIPVGVVVEQVSFGNLERVVINIEFAITRSETPARLFADMAGEDPIFADRATTMSGGLLGHRWRTQSVPAGERRFAWGFRVISGPAWVNVAVKNQHTSISTIITLGLYGFRIEAR